MGKMVGLVGGPGIFKVSTSKLNVVKLAEACLMRLSKIEGLRTRKAFKCDANAAQKW